MGDFRRFGILGEGMNDGFEGPRISPAEVLLERPKRTQKAAGTPWFPVSPLYPRLSVAGVVKSVFQLGLCCLCRDSNIVFSPYQVFAFLSTAVFLPRKDAAWSASC